MSTIRRLLRQPVHILAFLALFLVSGAADTAYHAAGLALGGDWLVRALGGGEAVAFNVVLAETGLHVLVAIGLLGFVISAFSHRLAEDEKRQREREQAEAAEAKGQTRP